MTGPVSAIILVDLVFLCWIDPPAGWIGRQSPTVPTKVPFFISFLAYCICDLLKRGGDRQMCYSDKCFQFNTQGAEFQFWLCHLPTAGSCTSYSPLSLILCAFSLRQVRNNPYSTVLLTGKDERWALSPMQGIQEEISKWKSLHFSFCVYQPLSS